MLQADTRTLLIVEMDEEGNLQTYCAASDPDTYASIAACVIALALREDATLENVLKRVHDFVCLDGIDSVPMPTVIP